MIVYRKIIILTFTCCSKNEREMLGRNNIQPPSCLRCTVLRKERLSSQGRQRGCNKLTFIGEIPRYLKKHVCGTYLPIYVIQLQMFVVNVNKSQKMLLGHFNRLCWRMCIQNALLLGSNSSGLVIGSNQSLHPHITLLQLDGAFFCLQHYFARHYDAVASQRQETLQKW